MSKTNYYAVKTLQHGSLMVRAGIAVTNEDINEGEIKKLVEKKILMPEKEYLAYKSKQDAEHKKSAKTGTMQAELDKAKLELSEAITELEASKAELIAMQAELEKSQAQQAEVQAELDALNKK